MTTTKRRALALEAHKWAFKARFRRNAFGWKSQPAITRIEQAVAEIEKVAKKDALLAAEGVVVFLERVSPALERVDSSSGSIGTAVNNAIEELVLKEQPAFAVGAGLLSLYWLVQGYGYEITGVDVLDAYRATLAAAERHGSSTEVKERVRKMLAAEPINGPPAWRSLAIAGAWRRCCSVLVAYSFSFTWTWRTGALPDWLGTTGGVISAR